MVARNNHDKTSARGWVEERGPTPTRKNKALRAGGRAADRVACRSDSVFKALQGSQKNKKVKRG